VTRDYDVVIAGGGLAGLCLARQLMMTRPELRVAVVERNQHPVPEAAHKVGESTGEVGAHYFAKVLGLEEHLETRHLRKTGLRFFYPADGNTDITKRVELGATIYLPTPTYQIDRGRLENHLSQEARRMGVDFIDGCKIDDLTLDPVGRHTLTCVREGATFELKGRWLVDTSGRPGLLKRRLDLGYKCAHDVNAAWFRLETDVDLQTWEPRHKWAVDMPERWRWRSTNHLMGSGYWFWLIALGTHATSFGLVADPSIHPLTEFNTFERMMSWLHRHEPQAAGAVESHRDILMDFRILTHFALGCRQNFSTDRWTIVGDAGFFLDPLYSVGSDFIGMGNTQTVDLICRELDGCADLDRRVEVANRVYQLFFDSVLKSFLGQYPLFGDSEVMIQKAIWDIVQYYAVQSLVFFHSAYADADLIEPLIPGIEHARDLNQQAQMQFRGWAKNNETRTEGARASLLRDGLFLSFTRDLSRPMAPEKVGERMAENLVYLERTVAELAEGALPAPVAR
jgi:flavin-dependent dehydrogenase